MEQVLLTDDNFEDIIKDSDKLIMIDFWATWCMPCKIMIPVIDTIIEKYKNLINIFKINIDEYKILCNTYNVMSVPTILFIKNNKVVEELHGVIPKNQIIDVIKKLGNDK